ncbi:MAG: CSLREA domain-containing protein [Anaerolineales bacterium]|nr:CSLREA domain-containing protein [Anaerolineales bacterium]
MVIRFKSIFNLFTLSALMLSLLGSALTFTPAYAANITVDTSADENNTGASCSLREAIIAANTNAAYGGCLAGSGTDTIAFADNYTITLSLGSQLPLVTTTISIKGNGATNTIVRANAAANTVTYRVFEVGGAGILTLSGLTVSNGVCLEACGGRGRL